ncbi:MAG: TatD family hydrolase [Clostridiales bacterium]|nr:TatD family hydrolase [Clostridiales bacterium]
MNADWPFLLPHNLTERPAEKRNEPRFLPHIAAEIAACRGETVDGLAEATTTNTKRFFGIE